MTQTKQTNDLSHSAPATKPESPDQYRKRYREVMLARASEYQSTGRIPQARELLSNTIRRKNWTRATLWWRLVALMETPTDYDPIRDLWMLGPAECHSHHSILRAIARAAAVSGNHHDCRVLLRKLIILLEQKKNARLGWRNINRIRKNPAVRSPANKADDQTSEFTEQASVALRDLNTAFRNIDLKAFLISGTLLGQVREGQIIGWDKDIDVGYFKEDCHLDLQTHFRASEDFRVGRVDLTSDRLRLIHKNGVWIDVFPHYMEGDLRWHNGTATRWWNKTFRLRTVDFIGVEQYIPDNPEQYLDENYGDWRTPVSDFDARLDAPNVEITDQEHLTSLLYFSIEKCVRQQKKNMLHRYIELLRARDNADWVTRLD